VRHRRLLAVLSAVGVGLLAAAEVAVSATRLPGFRSPSGNIRCLFIPAPSGARTSSATILCTIARADYAARLRARCAGPPMGLDWTGFTLSATRRGFVSCSGGVLFNPGTQRPSYVTLPYGRSWKHGAFTCRSRTTGVTCRNPRGHGLFVSRRSWRTW
jgi:hypothetical protein